jgi:hypothetical protein
MSDEHAEHECPRSLEQSVDEFDVGGMFLSPAGRWETITTRTPYAEYSARVTLHTDRTGPGYAWTFWRSVKFPYLPSWLARRPRHIIVFELTSIIDVEVTDAFTYGHGHTLLTARPVRGAGWEITDQPHGTTIESVTVPSKARARSEVNRRARAHAKRLGLPVGYEPRRAAA